MKTERETPGPPPVGFPQEERATVCSLISLFLKSFPTVTFTSFTERPMEIIEWIIIVDCQHRQGVRLPDLRSLAVSLQKPRTSSLLVLCGFVSHLRTCTCVTDVTRAWARVVWRQWPENKTKRDVLSPRDYRDCVFCKSNQKGWDVGEASGLYNKLPVVLTQYMSPASRKRKSNPGSDDVKPPVMKRARREITVRLEDNPLTEPEDASDSIIDEEFATPVLAYLAFC